MRLLFPTLIAASLTAGAVLAEPSPAEREAIEAYRQGIYPGQLRDIHDSAGFAVPLEVDWDSIALPGNAADYANEDYWTNVYFVPLAEALDMLTSYAEGRQAIRDRLKTIQVRYDPRTAPKTDYRAGVAFENGVLTVNFRPASQGTQIEERTEAIQSALERSF